jgi:hypothetical protein
MKKIISILLVGIMLAISLASCAGGSDPNTIAPEGMKLASLDNSAYYLYIPDNWVVQSSATGCGGAVSDPVESGDTVVRTDISNVIVTTFPVSNIKAETAAEEETTAAESEAANENITERAKYINAYWAMCKGSFERTFEEFSIVEEGKNTKVDSLEAKKYVYTAKMDGYDFKIMMTVTYSGGIVYIITYTAISEHYDKHTAEVDKIISAFKFK